MAVFVNHFLYGKVARVVKFTTVLLKGATSIGSVQVFLDQGLEFFGEAQYFSVLEVAEEVDHLGSGSAELGGVLVDLANQALLAVEVGGVEFSVGLLADADPVNDVELFPVNGVWVEGSAVFSTVVTPSVTVILISGVSVISNRGCEQVIKC